MADILDPRTGAIWEIVDGKMRRKPVQPSPYVNGVPKKCAHCPEQFNGVAYRGKSGALYCTATCRTWACDDVTTEDAARQVH